jgi:signal transduction histidine kinase
MALSKCRECGSPVASSAIACPQCGASNARSLKLGASLVLSGVLVAIVVAILLSRRTVGTSPEDDFIIASKAFVASHLTSPATASFAPADVWTSEEIDNHTQRLSAWVDSQNTFGAFIRDQFVAIVSHTNSEWKLEYLALSGNEIGTFRFTPSELAAIKAKKAVQDKAAAEQANAKLIAERQRIAAEKVADEAARAKMREQLDDLRTRASAKQQ